MLTMRAKYALLVGIVLASAVKARLPAHAIAAESRAPGKVLEAILLDLRAAGFVDSRRGHNGGHALARPAEQIMVGDLIRAIDGPLAPVRCASVTAYQPCSDCTDPHACGLRVLMREARDALCSVLDRRSLQELAITWSPNAPLFALTGEAA